MGFAATFEIKNCQTTSVYRSLAVFDSYIVDELHAVHSAVENRFILVMWKQNFKSLFLSIFQSHEECEFVSNLLVDYRIIINNPPH